MRIQGSNGPTYILISGLEVKKSIELSENVTLLPADTSHLSLDAALKACSSANDISVVTAFIPLVRSQFKIDGHDIESSTVNAWNSSWDALLLSAIFITEVGFNLQSNDEASQISADSSLVATNHFFRGFHKKPYLVTSSEELWIKQNFSNARKLLDLEMFQNAIHCLASFRWHMMPRIQLAVLWAGIEGLFGASTEIRFRLSLDIAHLLYPDAREDRIQKFESIKKLYNSRSTAVHGSKLKASVNDDVEHSAILLRDIILKIVELGYIPSEKELIF